MKNENGLASLEGIFLVKENMILKTMCTTILKIADIKHKAQLLVRLFPLNDLEDLQFVH